MTLSYNWLLDYLPRPVPVDELAEILTGIGLEVEGTAVQGTSSSALQDLIVAEVVSCEQHPNADRLKVTRVHAGGDTLLQVVCGAPNVAAGQKVILAPVGATLHPANGEAFRIKKSKIRGEVSEGMLCAADEIGLGADHSGIVVLPTEAVPGTPLKDAIPLPLQDTLIHIGLTPNRYDAASHYGTARDVAALLSHRSGVQEQAVLPPVSSLQTTGSSPVAVSIQAPEGCPRYMGILVTGVDAAPSPEWMQERLRAVGLRPINKLVDITNYVLQELGHPLHAFDADKIAGEEIIVRFAAQGEQFTTLDGTARTLEATDLLICDTDRPLAMAGVYGGLGSGVTSATTKVFLESAYFTPDVIRKTALRHSLRTDAAQHFEKGADIEMAPIALGRAARLIQECCPDARLHAVVDAYPTPITQEPISCNYAYVNRLSGKDFSPEEQQNILRCLGFDVVDGGSHMSATPPSWKLGEITQPADLVEEIIRIDGLDNIPTSGQMSFPAVTDMSGGKKLRSNIAWMLTGVGFSEVVTNSIGPRAAMQRTGGVQLLNSISAGLDTLRDSLEPAMLEVMAYNINRQAHDLLLYEFGSVYDTLQPGAYAQREALILSAAGFAVLPAWQQQGLAADAYFLKGLVYQILQRAGISGWTEEQEAATLYLKNKSGMLLAEIKTHQGAGQKLRQPVYTATIDWTLIEEASLAQKTRFSELPRFPEVHRDLAVVVARDHSFEALKAAVRGSQPPFLKALSVFDLFESEKLGAGKKSVGLRFTFAADRTLTDEEVDQAMQSLIQLFEKSFGAEIRS